jgi:predicted transcriptional regulator
MRRRKHPRGGRRGCEPRGVIVRRAERVFELNIQGRSQRQIADEVGISQPAVCKILRREEERRLGHLPGERLRLLTRQQARYEYIIREAFEGLARSWAERHYKQQQRSSGPNVASGERTTVKVTSVSGIGNARWLREAMGAMAEQRKLLQIAGFDWRELGLIFQEADGNVHVDESRLSEEEQAFLQRMSGKARERG